MASDDTSIALYQFMCNNIVGSDKDVKNRRLLAAAQDIIKSDDLQTVILSGSSGEGFDLNESDVDVVYVLTLLKVYEQTDDLPLNYSQKSSFIIDMENVKPGYTKLKLLNSCHRKVISCCNTVDGYSFLSNLKFKMSFLNKACEDIVHGPCISDIKGEIDYAYCLHSSSWISSAISWTNRSRNAWPTRGLKLKIRQRGVLFVPVGPKGSLREEIEGKQRKDLIRTLSALRMDGWRCILQSEQLKGFCEQLNQNLHQPITNYNETGLRSIVDEVSVLICSKVFHSAGLHEITDYHKILYSILHSLSSNGRRVFLYLLSIVCHRQLSQNISFAKSMKNKIQYTKYRRCLHHLLLSTNHDAVSGWLHLATFFYQMNQYRKCKYVLTYALQKCKPVKLCHFANHSNEQRAQLKSDIMGKKSVMRCLKLITVQYVHFVKGSSLIPRELPRPAVEGVLFIPPVVFAHFLCFLCHFHQQNAEKCGSSLRNLHEAITKDHCIPNSEFKARSYLILGVALQLVGNDQAANQAFAEATKYDRNCASSVQLLSRRQAHVFRLF
ncbi:unnamed protein product [Mytilus coruscus]|uniref:Mab-21-like HhH/H2TH-like domain-containing protein n=1 Tax=Mytilus coruscus TaxID=42192 RepID=A0A6J8BDD7_MYTCO|nr:unnamed protein product [Mytilus coruscus]